MEDPLTAFADMFEDDNDEVVAMHEQAKSLLQMFENGGGGARGPSNASSKFAAVNTSGRLRRNNLIANVKEALDSVDCDANENDLSRDPNEARRVNGVYNHKGVWYCQVHIEREQCRQCGVDYRLLYQVHCSRIEEAKIDDIIGKEQQRLEDLERQRIVLLPRMPERSTVVYFPTDAEDFQSIAKDLNEELAQAREKDKVNSLKCYALFSSSDERKLVL